MFYYNEVRYKAGPTPLVGWLKPYMLGEWFEDLNLHPDFMMDIPQSYTTYLNDIKQKEQSDKSRQSEDPKLSI